MKKVGNFQKFDAKSNTVKLPLILLLVLIISSQVLVFPIKRKRCDNFGDKQFCERNNLNINCNLPELSCYISKVLSKFSK